MLYTPETLKIDHQPQENQSDKTPPQDERTNTLAGRLHWNTLIGQKQGLQISTKTTLLLHQQGSCVSALS
jgi:hypothetical protein